jgi:hypothetical protein
LATALPRDRAAAVPLRAAVAPTLIKSAIDFRDQAMVENSNGVFQQSIALSSIDQHRRRGANHQRAKARPRLDLASHTNMLEDFQSHAARPSLRHHHERD